MSTDGLDQLASFLNSQAKDLTNSGSPQVLAASIEVSNTIARIRLMVQSRHAYDDNDEYSLVVEASGIQRAETYTFEDFTEQIELYLGNIQATGGYNSDLYAALGNAIIRRAIFTTSVEEDASLLQNVLAVAAALNPDITLAALDCLPQAWGNFTSKAAIIGISKVYLALLQATRFPEIQSVALYALAEALDRQFHLVLEPRSDDNCLQVDRSFEFDTEGLRYVLESDRDTPSLFNARMRISGCILLSEYVSQRGLDLHMQRYQSYLQTWGHMLCSAGDSNNVSHSLSPTCSNEANINRTSRPDWQLQKLWLPFTATVTLEMLSLAMSTRSRPFSLCTILSMMMTTRFVI